MNILPINGRVAIIDDKIEQAHPLMQELSKRKIPFVYYDAKPENLPSKDNINDLRLIFLDLNLIDDAVHKVKEIYPLIYANIDALVAENNVAYILACWSRTDNEFIEIVSKLKEDLPKKKPIAEIMIPKLDYFEFNGARKADYSDQIDSLFKKITDLYAEHTTFSNLVEWENHIHNATSYTLSEALSVSDYEWDDNNADWILTKLGQAYAGKHFSDKNDKEKKIASYHALNKLLEESISEKIQKTENSLFITSKDEKSGFKEKLNEKLMFSATPSHFCEPGSFIFEKNDNLFKNILAFAATKIVPELESKLLKNELEERKIKDCFFKTKRKLIRETWDTFFLVVNPICDFAQKKTQLNRIVPGILINAQHMNLINSSSEAIYISPIFHYSRKEDNYFFILDFRFFSALSIKGDEADCKYRLKQEVLSEIISKLARHINRQGILFID